VVADRFPLSLSRLVRVISAFRPGPQTMTLPLDGNRVRSQICYEIIFSGRSSTAKNAFPLQPVK
jgi:apolipoprotein N-acyltransferase